MHTKPELTSEECKSGQIAHPSHATPLSLAIRQSLFNHRHNSDPEVGDSSMAIKLGRNDPCWCDSGRKYKRCHLDRERQVALPLQDVIDRQKNAWSHRECLHPSAPAECGGKIVEAHTIQRGGGLERIARDGHVYAFKNPYPEIRETGQLMSPHLVGIKRASTFTGFCARHDHDLFRPIETAPIVPSPEQAFLLAYRAFCREFFQKERVPAFLPVIREMDRGKDPHAQQVIQGIASALQAGNAAGRRDGRHHKAMYDHALLTQDYSSVNFLSFELDQAPTVMCSGAYSPEYTFTGLRVQNLLRADHPSEVITVTLTATAEGGIGLLAWLGDQPAVAALADSLAALADRDIPDSLVRLVFETFDNMVASPVWWDALPDESRSRLLRRLNEGGLPLHTPDALLDDGLRAARWTVVRRNRSAVGQDSPG